ncbi:hypothetical protein [Rhodovulum sp. MB263]|uniref:hypothetical protein n=1 Tax=Rhodovulum sp. (strain MB263) TaxID=308754 RepID=UPI0018C88C83|nr:hypothetical protein [Rhodovulum sp. MB263]
MALSFLRNDCPLRAFSHDHLLPGRVRIACGVALLTKPLSPAARRVVFAEIAEQRA